MTVLRISGPEFLVDRFAAETPFKPQSIHRRGEADEGGAIHARSGAVVQVSLAPWTDWEAHVRDAAVFLGAARRELERLRPVFDAESLILDLPGVRRLGEAVQLWPLPSALAGLAAHHGIDVLLSLHPPQDPPASRHPRVYVHPDVCGGQPVIRGTRTTVSAIVAALGSGRYLSAILADHPEITADDVAAAVAFVTDQQEK